MQALVLLLCSQSIRNTGYAQQTVHKQQLQQTAIATGGRPTARFGNVAIVFWPAGKLREGVLLSEQGLAPCRGRGSPAVKINVRTLWAIVDAGQSHPRLAVLFLAPC